MNFTPEKIPSTREELDFKVIETYENLLNSYNAGLITLEMLDCSIKSVMAAAGWAVSKEVFLMLSEPVSDGLFSNKRYYVKTDGSFAAITQHPIQNIVMVFIGGVLRKKVICEPGEDSRMVAQGFSVGITTKSAKNPNPFKEITIT